MNENTVDPIKGIKVGERVRFKPAGSNRWWNVRARDERFLICDQQMPFAKAGVNRYTVLDATGWTSTYNGVRPGVVRSSINLIGGGYDMDEPDWANTMLAELQAGDLELSVRRVVRVDDIERETPR